MNDQMVVTASEDYGEDVEHVEQLILVFDSFVSNLAADEKRVQECLAKGGRLLEEKNPIQIDHKDQTRT